VPKVAIAPSAKVGGAYLYAAAAAGPASAHHSSAAQRRSRDSTLLGKRRSVEQFFTIFII